MPTAINKAIVYWLFAEAWNEGKLDVIDRITAPTAVTHAPGNAVLGHGPEASKQLITLYRTGVPDLHVTIEEMIADDDRVVTRWTGRGTSTGVLPGVAPTGQQAVMTGVSIFRSVDARIVESWPVPDNLGLLPQLSVSPAGHAPG